MRVLVQRVSEASVTINHQITSKINQGLVILLGIEDTDTLADCEWLCNKIINLRVFNDQNGIMNVSVSDIKGDLLVISQFTLYASTKKGNRPSYIRASKPEIAIPIYEFFISYLKKISKLSVFTGEFGAYMKINLTNDGPVTIFIDSNNKE